MLVLARRHKSYWPRILAYWKLSQNSCPYIPQVDFVGIEQTQMELSRHLQQRMASHPTRQTNIRVACGTDNEISKIQIIIITSKSL